MSVYYNIEQFNKQGEDIDFRVQDQSFDAILDNQSQYQVGVKRFKIPASTIPLFRIYPRRYLIGSDFYSQTDNSATTQSKIVIHDLFTQNSILKSNFDKEEREYFQTIYSQKHFTQILTRTYLDTILSRCRFLTQGANHFTNATISAANQLTRGVSTNTQTYVAITTPVINTFWTIITPTTALTQIPVGGAAPDANPEAVGGSVRKVVGWEVHITSLALNTGDDVFIEDLDFHLEYSTIRDLSQANKLQTDLSILNNLCPSKKVSEFNSIFPNGVRIASYGRLREKQASDFYSANGAIPTFYVESDADLDLIMGTAGEYADIGFGVNLRKSYANMPTFVISATISLFSSNQLGLTGRVVLERDNDLANIQPPYFNYNQDSKKIEYNTLFSYEVNGFTTYFNQGLRNILGFDTMDYPLRSKADFVCFGDADNYTDLNCNFGGGIAQFDLPDGLQNILAGTEFVNIPETEESNFKRNYLYSLVITSNSLSIDGEYEGDGQSTRKILSDFEADPSTNFRDYLIYQPEGRSVRYYDMKSTQPLRQIFVQVFYKDINGHLRPLTIGAGYTGSIKLHFRKKPSQYSAE